MRRTFPLLVGAVVTLAGVTLATGGVGSSEPSVAPVRDIAVSSAAAARLAAAVRIPTISAEDPSAFDGRAFLALHAYLQGAFPLAHAQLLREVVGGHSLLYTWQGSDRSLNPILLAGHLDVVPIEPGTEQKWQQDPFGGRIVDGQIWGRGALDNKSAVVGTLEAVEMLLAERFQPARTVYLAFGHDEEVGGTAGAREIAALLKRRGVELEMVLDEGGVISDGILSGISAPVALVGIAEKGFVTIELRAATPGGHSSLPPRQTAVGILSAAIARLEASPMRARLEGATRELFNRIGPQFRPMQRLVFANLWLTRPLVMRRLENVPTTNAMVRTTTAVTMFHAGTKDNVLPSVAEATINFRIVPGDSIASVVEHVREVVDDDRVEVAIGGRFSAEPSNVSSTDSESFRTLDRTIRTVSPDVVVAPYLVVVVTDARYYSELSRNVFRFLPVRLASSDLERMHGIDERIGIPEYEEAVRIYRRLIIECTGDLPRK